MRHFFKRFTVSWHCFVPLSSIFYRHLCWRSFFPPPTGLNYILLLCVTEWINESEHINQKKYVVRSPCLEHLCHILPIWSRLSFFTAKPLIIPYLLCLLFSIKRNAGVGDNVVYCTPSLGADKTMWWRKRGKKISKELEFFFLLLSLCWIVLFDLECSERRPLCNISSTHMAVCVTAKHTGGSSSSGDGGGGGSGCGGSGSGSSGGGVLRWGKQG